MYSKPWYTSRTIWLNILVVLSSIIMLATETFSFTDDFLKWALFLQGMINIVLRSVTEEPLSLK